jgi:hypothetical protein
LLLALLFHAVLAHAAEPVLVELDPTASALPEGDIRIAIERELGRPVTAPSPGVPADVQIAVANQQIVVRVRQNTAVIERSVPLPANLDDVPLTVSLIVGNLARDQSVAFAKPEPEPEPAAPAPPAPPASATTSRQPTEVVEMVEPPRPAYRKVWFGLHAAQDFAIVGGNNVCDSNLGQKSANYACFYQDTDNQPFVHTPYPFRDGIQQGMVLATARVLFSADFAFSPWFSLGGRTGYAFGGGPPAGQTVPRPESGEQIPDRAIGQGGTPFMPFHLELTARGWFAPLTNERVRAYVGASVGAAQVDAKVRIPEYDCTHAGVRTIDPSDVAEQSQNWDPDDPAVENGNELTPFQQCRLGKGHYDYKLYKPVLVDAWKKMGQAFVSLGVGGMFALTDQLGVVLNLNVMLMLPAPGLVLEPSLGVEVGL